MRPLPFAVLLSTALLPFASISTAEHPGAPASGTLPSASGDEPRLSSVVEQVPDWVEPPGQESCLFAIEPLTGEARDLGVGFSHLPHLDILPHHCPNNLHVDDDDDDDDDDDCSTTLAAMPIAVLGNDFDVTQIDLNTVRLSRLEPSLATGPWPLLTPYQWSYTDIGTPFEGAPCGCNNLHGDGALDIKLKFVRQDVIDTFELAQEPSGTNVLLRISGRSPTGIGFRVYDCVHILTE